MLYSCTYMATVAIKRLINIARASDSLPVHDFATVNNTDSFDQLQQ